MRQIILDTETTGLSPEQGHRIIEIGCIEMNNRLFSDANFHHYLDPERDIDAAAQQVHGITRESLMGKPKFHDIAEAFIEYIQGAELIIHNAAFDVGFLNYELAKLGGKYQRIQDYCRVIDTLKMARRKHPGQKNNLDALCKRYQVDASRRKFHGALLDAQILGEVYLAMTVGQIDFLTVAEVPKQHQKVTRAKITANRQGNLMVQPPLKDELKAHEMFLERLRRKARKTLAW